jgi:hypothetical protein
MHIQEIGENVLMAFDTLHSQGALGSNDARVIGGTMTVIAISSFLTGLREFVLEQTKRFGPDIVFVTSGTTSASVSAGRRNPNARART